MNTAPNMSSQEYYNVHGKYPQGNGVWHWKIRFVPEIITFEGSYTASRKEVYKKIMEVQPNYDMPIYAELQP